MNLGGGTEHRIADVAAIIADVVGFRGQLRFDRSQPDGAAFKALDSSKLLALGWRPTTDFRLAVMSDLPLVLTPSGHGTAHLYASPTLSALYQIHQLEEEVARVYATNKIKSAVHLSMSQAVVRHLRSSSAQ